MGELIHIVDKELAEERGASQSQASGLPSIKDAIAASPHILEDQIIHYLERSPNYSAAGKVVGDALDPECDACVFPGANTDGLYVWPLELAYYVRKYHVQLPDYFLRRMEELNWKPPKKSEINFDNLYKGLAT